MKRFLRVLLVGLSLGSAILFPAGGAQATTTGAVVAWGCTGLGDFGQCNVPSGLSGVNAVAAGTYHSLALKDDGTVSAWGCADGANAGQCDVPNGLADVTAVAAGQWHSLALMGDGTVVAWGCITFFNAGQCDVPSGLSGVTAVAAGAYDSLALKSDGTVVAWGCAIGGGDNVGQCDVPSGLSGVTAVSAGDYHSLASKSDGTVVAWGCGTIFRDFGQCNVPSGLSDAIAIAAGNSQSLAAKADGSVVAWGCLYGGPCDVPSGLSGVTSVAAGFFHSLALKSDGTVVAWCGGPDFGQCNVPSGLSGVTAIAAGGYHSLASGELNRPPDCSGVNAAPSSISRMSGKMALVALSGATDPDSDTLSYQIDGVTQDEYVTGVGDDTFPDAALTLAGASSNQVFVRSEANSHFNGRVYRVAYTVTDGNGGSCSGTDGPTGTTTARVSVPRKKGAAAIDDGNAMSWDSFTGAAVP